MNEEQVLLISAAVLASNGEFTLLEAAQSVMLLRDLLKFESRERERRFFNEVEVDG